jgi:hypothetical protein
MQEIIVQWVIQQGPVVAIAFFGWWREYRRAERLADELEECHKREIAALADHSNP